MRPGKPFFHYLKNKSKGGIYPLVLFSHVENFLQYFTRLLSYLPTPLKAFLMHYKSFHNVCFFRNLSSVTVFHGSKRFFLKGSISVHLSQKLFLILCSIFGKKKNFIVSDSTTSYLIPTER